ncbi:hypothetical protein JYU34_017184 [Plutella xylostella]|uniref:Gustatory receptor n=1 Tax=Plutella xylostella TaxID=51655 RepID=A0ABQ7Q0U7_PLUXY|nr:hypothetical protein JYU34_017184 [Plutella xylostella]
MTRVDTAQHNNGVKAKSIEVLPDNVTSILSCVKPLLFLENLFGIFRFRNNSGKLHLSGVNVKILGIVIFIVYIAIFYTFTDVLRFGRKKLLDNVPTFILHVEYIVTIVLTSFVLVKTNIEIYLGFSEIDKSLYINADTTFYKRSRRHTYLLLGSILLVHFSYNLLPYMFNLFSIETLIIWPVYFLQDLEILFFCKLICMLKTRLHIINKHLNNAACICNGNRNIYTITGEALTDFLILKKIRIVNLASVYHKIAHLCSLVNELFNFLIFMSLISVFFYTLITICMTLYYVQIELDVKTTAWLSIKIVWNIIEMGHIVSIIVVCEMLVTTRKKTKVLITEIIINYNLQETMRMEAKSFLKLVEAWPLKISVYDMFYVDTSLLLKFINVCTVYLIFMLQIPMFINFSMQ